MAGFRGNHLGNPQFGNTRLPCLPRCLPVPCLLGFGCYSSKDALLACNLSRNHCLCNHPAMPDYVDTKLDTLPLDTSSASTKKKPGAVAGSVVGLLRVRRKTRHSASSKAMAGIAFLWTPETRHLCVQLAVQPRHRASRASYPQSRPAWALLAPRMRFQPLRWPCRAAN